MEDIEKLKQDNAKLQERLNNAAKFFREQKAQIESLTKENEILVEKTKTYEHKIDNLENNNDDVQKLEIKIDELEKTITSKDQAYKVLQDTYNEVFAEKEKITKQYKEQEKFETDVINVKVPELEEKLHALQQTHDDLGVDYDKLNAKYNELLKEKDKQVTMNESLAQSLAKTEADLDIVRKSDNEYRKAFEELQDKYKANDIAKGEAELRAQTLNDEYTKKFAEQETQIETLKKKFEEEGKNAVANKVLLDEANEKLTKLNELYDNCENEKLAIQNDYNTLSDKIKTMELDMVNKDEIIKSYQEQLDNENILRFNKEDINNLCDYVLDFFKDKQLKDENE